VILYNLASLAVFIFLFPLTAVFLTRLVFTVVSDPPDEDEEGDCVDVAYASVDFVQVSRSLHSTKNCN